MKKKVPVIPVETVLDIARRVANLEANMASKDEVEIRIHKDDFMRAGIHAGQLANIPEGKRNIPTMSEGPQPDWNPNSSPLTKNSIGESANKIHDSLDNLHSVLDALKERLASISLPSPLTQATTSVSPPESCPHMQVLATAKDRVQAATSKVADLLNNVLI